MVARYDSNFKIETFKRTPQGYLDVAGIVTRTGIFVYDTGNELRPHNEVMKQESLDTLRALPVTWNHPPDLLTPSTTAQYMKGFLGSQGYAAKKEKLDVVKVDSIIITDPTLINAVENGEIREWSMGYDCKLVDEVGVHEGIQYAKKQTDIVYNHLACVPAARGGSICSIVKKGDSAMVYKTDADMSTNSAGEITEESARKADKGMAESEKKDAKKKDKKKKDEEYEEGYEAEKEDSDDEESKEDSSEESKEDSDDEEESKEKEKKDAKKKDRKKKGDAAMTETNELIKSLISKLDNLSTRMDSIEAEKTKKSDSKEKDPLLNSLSNYSIKKEYKGDSSESNLQWSAYDRNSHVNSLINGKGR
jgi:hypothetical protein